MRFFGLPYREMFDRPMRLMIVACVVLLVPACTPPEDTPPEDTQPVGTAVEAPAEIVNITGDLYEVRSGTHKAVFLVTGEGIILTDPTNLEVAEWLKAEFARRFDRTVTYVIYSHHHPDHVAGGIAFADTATFVGHENVTSALAAPLPSNAATLDQNGDGQLDRSEATALGYGGQNFNRYDRNGDGTLTGVEINAETPVPDIVYSTNMTITLGGSSVELMHPGRAHSDDMTVLLFPQQRALFAVDFMQARRFPATLGGYPLASYVDAIAKVQTFDFDIAIPGHGNVGEKADVALFLEFLRALDAAVAEGIAEGRSLDEMRENLSFPGYEDWLRYETRRDTLITETYELLTRP